MKRRGEPGHFDQNAEKHGKDLGSSGAAAPPEGRQTERSHIFPGLAALARCLLLPFR
jgi:hypothetical protein